MDLCAPFHRVAVLDITVHKEGADLDLTYL